jgi:3-methyladenine DNA glycosylase AlkD
VIRSAATGRTTKSSSAEIAAEVRTALAALAELSVPQIRKLRRNFSRRLRSSPGSVVRSVALQVAETETVAARLIACELVAEHPEAFAGLTPKDLTRLGKGMADWASVDTFGCTVAGRAWREGILSDASILSWAKSADRWQRRLALVATVPLNSRARGGSGDNVRTLKVCQALVDDRDDMVVKALSWALRELSKRDSKAVAEFLARFGSRLASQVRREVTNKLKTGLKNPRG